MEIGTSATKSLAEQGNLPHKKERDFREQVCLAVSAAMLDFPLFLRREKPLVNAALERAVQRLPISVQNVAGYALLSGGKRLRPLLTLMSARLLGYQGNEQPDLYDLAAIPEMIHVASLLHDDVLDGASTRRGKQAAHLLFGISPCLLAGDALLASANCRVAEWNNPALTHCVSDALLRTVTGEIEEIALQGSLEHGMDRYLDMIAGKTGWLLRASCRLGALFAGAESPQVEAISDFGLNAGIAFQMVDDALDFADESVTGKPTGGDLREGKFTPPVMSWVQTLNESDRADFAARFSGSGLDEADVARISAQIRQGGHDARTRRLASTYLDRACRALDCLPKRPERELFRQALDFVRDRAA